MPLDSSHSVWTCPAVQNSAAI